MKRQLLNNADILVNPALLAIRIFDLTITPNSIVNPMKSAKIRQEYQVLGSGNGNRILLYNRGSLNPKPKTAIAEMLRYLEKTGLQPPYVLVAHSYGGTVGREFLQQRPDTVVGMILVETGQETALDLKVEEDQYRRQILGSKPLSVIRGNVMIEKIAQLDARLQACENETQRSELKKGPEYALIQALDEEDERLKKKQLALSRNSRYVHIPDCGHGVIRARPDVVAAEVRWVMEVARSFAQVEEESKDTSARHGMLHRIFAKLKPNR
ncbi:hypothetical protein S40285_03913 [Stachybotrys chlorohalonatus IBT 40285]|uniref:AB hydrolase-1 domain-containing protein n=1 Tax=Stachybotrys chlorohalonatus (strain IBT 40285) TaxID=1283841 RepID=A0A084R174_STAC4|nr:hypothetical protein S40285_03913 [Stachybotrys chlorohalonata IBT 40285]